MIKNILYSLIGLSVCFQSLMANDLPNIYPVGHESMDTLRLAELDRYWANLSNTVSEGDFEGYSAAYHEDAVVIFATGQNKMSVSLSKALNGWKQGFDNTKAGKQKDSAVFRFSQRIGDETTAHETGIFWFKSVDSNGKVNADQLVHFEMLLVKKNNEWLGMMEYQKSMATKAEWDALK